MLESEGFVWTGPGGRTLSSHAVDGDWSKGPEVPDEVRVLFDPEYRDEQAKARQEREGFADFLAGLVGSGPRFKVTFKHAEGQDGETVAYPPNADACVATVRDFLAAGGRRAGKSVITVEVRK